MTQEPEPTTRERILAAAARLFAERGYAGTSVRDIASELGIANPSIYYHFKSKGELLVELLAEPLNRVETAVEAAKNLTGEARARHIIEGLLGALEVHHGLVITVSKDKSILADPQVQVVLEMRPQLSELLKDVTAEENRALRLTMAVGAVEGVVTALTQQYGKSAEFVAQLRQQRDAIIDIALGILRG